MITLEDGSAFDTDKLPAVGALVTVRSRRPLRTFNGSFVKFVNGFVVVKRSSPAHQLVAGQDLAHTLVRTTVKVKSGGSIEDREIIRTRPMKPPAPTEADHNIVAFGASFLARAQDALEQKIQHMRRVTERNVNRSVDGGLDRSWATTSLGPLVRGEVVVVNIRDTSEVHVASVFAVNGGTVELHMYAHDTMPSTEYDFELDLAQRTGLANEWLTGLGSAEESWYASAKRRSKKDVANIVKVPVSDCNILRRGITLERRNGKKACLPLAVCEDVLEMIENWSDVDGMTPAVGDGAWLRQFLTTLGGLQVAILTHGKRLYSLDAKNVIDGGRPVGTRCQVVCTKTEAAKKSGTCRLGYGNEGREVVMRTHVDQDGRIRNRRNYPHLVPHNIALTVILRCSKSSQRRA